MDDSATLSWTDEQWSMLNQLVQDTARKARVVTSLLPIVGPLPAGQAYVPAMRMDVSPRGRLDISDVDTLPLLGISCPIEIKISEAHDPELSAVRQMLTRAADVLGRLEDEIVLNGVTADRDVGGRGRLTNGAPYTTKPQIYQIRGPKNTEYPGILGSARQRQYAKELTAGVKDGADQDDTSLVSQIVHAVQDLEDSGYSPPFACILGNRLFLTAVSPAPSMVLPSDRITPFLKGGPLLRSGSLDTKECVLISLGGAPIDVVVGSDLRVRYISRSDTHYTLDLSESFRLRIKDEYADGPAIWLTPPDDPQALLQRFWQWAIK